MKYQNAASFFYIGLVPKVKQFFYSISKYKKKPLISEE